MLQQLEVSLKSLYPLSLSFLYVLQQSLPEIWLCVWREPRHIACHLGSQFTSPFGWWFFRILFSSAHWLNWQWLAEGDPHTWNTCFPPVSLMSRSRWTLNRKLAGILHGWVGFSTFLQESVPNWHHMGGHLRVTLPVLHQAHLPTCERDQGRPESPGELAEKLAQEES